ncbi:MAG: 4Fe-4S binding protein [Sedimentisphaerales bacterium]|nr:4Fe-4S binding protein [Sedimentisphaerales bacterium]
MRSLRWIRLAAGAAVLIAFCCVFVLDEHLIGGLHRILPRTQFLPALMGLISWAVIASVIVLALICIATLILGRVYCAFLCPLGILQDALLRLETWLRIRRRYSYQRPRPFLRYTVLILAGLGISSGILAVVTWFDPYSLFGRMTYALLSAPIRYMVQVVNPILDARGILLLSDLSKGDVPIFILVAGVLILGLLVVFTVVSGRFYCTSICPVGTFLGLLSRHSLLKIHMDPDTCINCARCERVCRSGCIDSKNGIIDHSCCVMCLDCLAVCPKGSISYGTRPSGQESVPIEQRRTLLGSGLALAGIGIVPGLAIRYARASTQGRSPVMPPGAVSMDHLKSHCTACQLCVSKCPTNVLQPTLFGYGLDGILIPHLDFTRGYCTFDCALCGHVCPNKAILPLTKEQKHTVQLGMVELDEGLCVTYTKHEDCGACIEHCPTHAIYGELTGGVNLPKVRPEGCVGCGACVHTCPVGAVRVIGHAVHRQAKILGQSKTPQVEGSQTQSQQADGFLF